MKKIFFSLILLINGVILSGSKSDLVSRQLPDQTQLTDQYWLDQLNEVADHFNIIKIKIDNRTFYNPTYQTTCNLESTFCAKQSSGPLEGWFQAEGTPKGQNITTTKVKKISTLQ